MIEKRFFESSTTWMESEYKSYTINSSVTNKADFFQKSYKFSFLEEKRGEMEKRARFHSHRTGLREGMSCSGRPFICSQAQPWRKMDINCA